MHISAKNLTYAVQGDMSHAAVLRRVPPSATSLVTIAEPLRDHLRLQVEPDADLHGAPAGQRGGGRDRGRAPS
jgi:hypothetical protein